MSKPLNISQSIKNCEIVFDLASNCISSLVTAIHSFVHKVHQHNQVAKLSPSTKRLHHTYQQYL